MLSAKTSQDLRREKASGSIGMHNYMSKYGDTLDFVLIGPRGEEIFSQRICQTQDTKELNRDVGIFTQLLTNMCSFKGRIFDM